VNLVTAALLTATLGFPPLSTMSTVAGSGPGFPGAHPGFGGDGGPATSALLARPAQVSGDGRGGFYIADSSNQRIRYVNPDGKIATVAGTGRQDDCGDRGNAWDLCLNLPHGVLARPGGAFVIADSFNHKVREVDARGRMRTLAGPADGLQVPVSVQPAAGKGLLIADAGGDRVYLYRDGKVRPIAGSATRGFAGDGGPAASAQLSEPADAVPYRGGVAIADGNNCRIRFVDGAGRISTIAGSGDPGRCEKAAKAFDAGNPPPTDARRGLDQSGSVDARTGWIGVPGHLAVMGGTLYLVDVLNNSVRALSGGHLTTVAGGGGLPGFNGNAGSARPTNLAWPSGLSVSKPGELLVSDPGNNRVRVIRTV
jgi:hypothetical protein